MATVMATAKIHTTAVTAAAVARLSIVESKELRRNEKSTTVSDKMDWLTDCESERCSSCAGAPTRNSSLDLRVFET